MAFNLTHFVHTLQHSNDGVKKRWVLGTAFLCTLLLIGIWILIPGTILPPIGNERLVAQASSSTDTAPQKESPLKVMERGFSEIKNTTKTQFDRLSTFFKSFEGSLKKGNEISITPSSSDSTTTTP